MLPFWAIEELQPGTKWQALFERLWPAYRRWYVREGVLDRPTFLECRRALRAHMPELAPVYEQLCALAGGDDLAARFLSHYRPPAYLSGCSQAIWPGAEPMMVRNYDYSAQLFDAVLLKTAWLGRRVMGMSDGMIGLVDGVNDAGLAASLTFGGSRQVGDGFGVPLIMRYVLETCETAKDAAAALVRIPSHMAYNVTVLDRAGGHFTVYLAPDREAVVSHAAVATNHQEHVEWRYHARATATVERERYLLQRLTLHEEPAEDFIAAFLKPPLYSLAFARGFGTLYTAVYWPRQGAARYCWPGSVWAQSLDGFREGMIQVRYPEEKRL
jgi:predicted choloylglycine hydrolase